MRESPLPGFAGEAGLLDGRVVVAIAKCMALCGLGPEGSLTIPPIIPQDKVAAEKDFLGCDFSRS